MLELDGMSVDSVQLKDQGEGPSRNLHSSGVDRQSRTGLIFRQLCIVVCLWLAC